VARPDGYWCRAGQGTDLRDRGRRSACDRLARRRLEVHVGAWKYTIQDIFEFEGNAIASGVTKAKKCGGGKLGTYDYRSFVYASGGDTELEVEVKADLSVREEFRRLKNVQVSADASPNYPPDVLGEIVRALAEFHETVFTRYKAAADKLKVRHGELALFGNVVVEPGESATTFKPKPGC
jgi:hypothetical protein